MKRPKGIINKHIQQSSAEEEEDRLLYRLFSLRRISQEKNPEVKVFHQVGINQKLKDLF